MKYFINYIKSGQYKNRNIVTLLTLFIVTIIIHLVVFFQHDYAMGVDGYYYATQVRYFREYLQFASPDISLSLYYLVLFSFLGTSIIVTNKIAISLLASLLLFPAYLIGKRVHSATTGILFAAFILSSSFLTHFTYEYVKNLGGIFFFLFFIHALISLFQENSRKRVIKAAAAFLLVLFTHKLMAATALLLIIFVMAWTYRGKFKKAALALSVIVVILMITGALFPNILHMYDFQRILSSITPVPQLLFLGYWAYEPLTPALVIELIIYIASPLALILTWGKLTAYQRKCLGLFILVMILCNFPFVKFNITTFSFRLFILIFIPASFFISISLTSLRRFNFIALLIIVTLLMPYKYLTMKRLSKNNNCDYALYTNILPLIDLPKDSLLVAHQGFDYFYSFHTKKRSFHFLPEAKHKKRPTYRLAYAVKPDLYREYLGEKVFENSVRLLPGFYSLLKEDLWIDFITKVPEGERRKILTWRNPYKNRAGYMLRNQKFRKEQSAR